MKPAGEFMEAGGEPGPSALDERAQRDIRIVQRISAIDSILKIVCSSTGLRFAAVARVTEANWTACSVLDLIDFGLKAGEELPIATTLCDQIRGTRQPVVIDHVATDSKFRDHQTPALYGFQSYISLPILRKDGAFFGTLCALDPLPAKLSDVGTVAMFTAFAQMIGMQIDVEEQLELSERTLSSEQEVAELREQFIAVLGHDLRNPLFSITLNAELLSRLVAEPRATRLIDGIRKSGDRMALLISNLMDFSQGRLGGGIRSNMKLTWDLADVLNHVISELRVIHRDREINTKIEIDKPVHCDPQRIAQVLSNLLANALTHGDAGTVTVHARIQEPNFVLEVTNGAEPIPRSKIGRLFEPFSRSQAEARTDGLGLGLYIVSEIAKAQGGTISVVSEPEGTTFTFEMPAQQM